MPDLSPIHPLLRLTFTGFTFLALGWLLLSTSVTACPPLFSRVCSGFVMSPYVFSRSQVTTRALFVFALLSIPLGFCYLYTLLRSVSSFYRLYVLSLSDFGNQCLAPTPRAASSRASRHAHRRFVD